MKRSALSAILILLLFVMTENACWATSSATISLNPTILDTLHSQNFALNLSINGVADLYLWVATIQWDSSVLNLTEYSEGPFLAQEGQTTFMAGKVTPGKIEGLTCTLQGNVPGVTGNGTLAVLEFNSSAVGMTSVSISFSDLLDSSGMSIRHGIVDSSVNVSPIHDVAVSDVTPLKTVVGVGLSLAINLTVENQGDTGESFNVIVYGNTTAVGTSGNLTLASRNSETVCFIWSTTSFAKGKYSISAYASAVRNETDTNDNTFTDGWIMVAMIGDITGPDGCPDGKCDARDVALIARLFGAKYLDPRYDLNCDLTGLTKGLADGKIDARDIALVASRYGQKDP